MQWLNRPAEIVTPWRVNRMRYNIVALLYGAFVRCAVRCYSHVVLSPCCAVRCWRYAMQCAAGAMLCNVLPGPCCVVLESAQFVMYIVVPCRDIFSGCNLLADRCQFALISLLHCASLKNVPALVCCTLLRTVLPWHYCFACVCMLFALLYGEIITHKKG